jgi:carbon storage regulator
MLVLSRKENEAVAIGDEITVKVLEIRGDRVRLGIDAPENVTVHRQEIWLQIKQEIADANAVFEPQPN